jgi:hypothetical protein
MEKKDKVKITHEDYINHPRTQQFTNAIAQGPLGGSAVIEDITRSVMASALDKNIFFALDVGTLHANL